MYSYIVTENSPTSKSGFKNIVKHTRGKFSRVTEPMGPFEFRYAVFANKASEILIPVHDLTPETKKAINLA